MSVLPFFHIYGMVVQMHLALWCGATQVVLPKFDMTQYLELVKRHRATQLFVVPPVALDSPSIRPRNTRTFRPFGES